MIRRRQLRLTATFRKLLVLSLAAPAGAAAYACSSSSSDGGSTGDGGSADGTSPDASGGDDGSSAFDTGPNDAGTTDAEAGPHCTPGLPYFSDASIVDDASADGGPASCYYFVDYTCDPHFTTATGVNGCYLYLSECENICTLDGGAFFDCLYQQGAGCDDASVVSTPGQPITIACGLCSGVGRRPAGLVAGRRARSASALGAFFAEAAHLEAASVFAFEQLRGELAFHGAPSELVATAARAIEDEVRHARVTTRLARRFGSEPPAARVKRRSARALEAVARENAVEGCVRETFGAMIATWQAAHAADADVRKRMRRIAADEKRHAALAWAVAAWADEKLDAKARARVLRARRAAVRALSRQLASDLPAAERRAAGLPSPAEARAIFDALAERAWSRGLDA